MTKKELHYKFEELNLKIKQLELYCEELCSNNKIHIQLKDCWDVNSFKGKLAFKIENDKQKIEILKMMKWIIHLSDELSMKNKLSKLYFDLIKKQLKYSKLFSLNYMFWFIEWLKK